MRKHRTGSVYERKDGRWVAQITILGKRKYYYRQSEEEAWEVLAAYNRQRRAKESLGTIKKTARIEFF